MEIQAQTMTVNDTQINYIDSGPNDGPVVLFIHGNSHSLSTFDLQFKSPLLSKCRLIALDLPGHGDSGNLPEYSLEAFAAIIGDWAKTLKMSPDILVGHSLGGHVATHLIKELKPAGVFNFGYIPLEVPFNPMGYLPHPAGPLFFQGELTSENRKTMAQALYWGDFQANQEEMDIEKVRPEVRPQLFASIAQGQYSDEMEIWKSYNGMARFVLGEHDGLINRDFLTALFIEQLDQERPAIIPKSGHNIHRQADKVFNLELKKFIESVFEKSGKSDFVQPQFIDDRQVYDSRPN